MKKQYHWGHEHYFHASLPYFVFSAFAAKVGGMLGACTSSVHLPGCPDVAENVSLLRVHCWTPFGGRERPVSGTLVGGRKNDFIVDVKRK